MTLCWKFLWQKLLHSDPESSLWLTLLFSLFQVALVAVTILGNEVEANNNSMSPDGEGGQIPSSHHESEDLSITDDIAFSMYVDVDVADTIRKLEAVASSAYKGTWYFLSSVV